MSAFVRQAPSNLHKTLWAHCLPVRDHLRIMAGGTFQRATREHDRSGSPRSRDHHLVAQAQSRRTDTEFGITAARMAGSIAVEPALLGAKAAALILATLHLN